MSLGFIQPEEEITKYNIIVQNIIVPRGNKTAEFRVIIFTAYKNHNLTVFCKFTSPYTEL